MTPRRCLALLVLFALLAPLSSSRAAPRRLDLPDLEDLGKDLEKDGGGPMKPDKAKMLSDAYDATVKDSEEFEGFFTFRLKEGSLYADLGGDDFDKTFLLVGQVARGVSRGMALGGMMLSMGDEWVLEFRKVEDRVILVRKNIRFKADEDTPLGEAVDISFSDSIIASFDPVGVSGGNTLISLDGYLLSDLFDIGPMFGGAGVMSSLSNWESVKSFPRNSELEAVLTYSGMGRGRGGTVPDPGYVTLTMHYSFVAMPEDGFEPRKADDRVGHFITALKDFSRPTREGPYVRYVNRWHLEKARAGEEKSAVKEPIVFYLEKTIPYEYRPYVRAGILEWNKAFEKAGLIDAIEVRVQAKDAEWDPEDVRYNTIRWITSPYTFAIGPSHSNPLTGQILDADILIDNSWISYWQKEVELYDIQAATTGRGAWARKHSRSHPRAARGAGAGAYPPRLDGDGVLRDHRAFALGFASQFALGALHVSSSVESTKGDAKKKDKKKKKDDGDEKKAKKKGGEVEEEDADAELEEGDELPLWYIGSALKDLVMHEVGHTLGLRHNFRASTIRTREELHDADLTRKEGLAGSVMDYLPVNLAPEGTKQGEYHPSTIGPYDYWAIEYAYSEASDEELEEIAARCASPELTFATDEDAWVGLDPLVATWDIGSDPIAYAKDRLAHVKKLWGVVLDRVVDEGEGYQRARRAVVGLLIEVAQGAMLAASHLGGQHHYRDHKGDPDARANFVLVDVAKQREALAFLGEGIFADASYGLSPELLNRLAPNHWWHWGESPQTPLDFPFHEWVQLLQEFTLYWTLDPHMIQRLLDAERKAAPGTDLLTGPELTGTLTKMIFSELASTKGEKPWDARNPYISGTRRNLQRTYVSVLSRLVTYLPSGWYADAPVVARAELEALRTKLADVRPKLAGKVDAYSAGHLADLDRRIEQVLEAEREAGEF